MLITSKMVLIQFLRITFIYLIIKLKIIIQMLDESHSIIIQYILSDISKLYLQ